MLRADPAAERGVRLFLSVASLLVQILAVISAVGTTERVQSAILKLFER